MVNSDTGASFSSWWTVTLGQALVHGEQWHWGRLLSASTSLSKIKVFCDVTPCRLVASQHSVTSQKILTFTSTAVRASDVVGQVGTSPGRSTFRCTKLKSRELKNKMYILWIILDGGGRGAQFSSLLLAPEAQTLLFMALLLTIIIPLMLHTHLSGPGRVIPGTKGPHYHKQQAWIMY